MNRSRLWSHSTFLERGFVGALAVLCVLLTALQYYWTGEVSHATTQMLRAGFSEQVPLLCQAFDTELTNAYNQLLPYEDELDSDAGWEQVHLEHFRRWQTTHPRPMFRRLAVAVRSGSTLQLFVLDQHVVRFAPAPWPAEWSRLRDNLLRKVQGKSSPPFEDAAGTLLESPFFRDGEESEWAILELDLDYVSKTWLPDLVRTYLNREGHATCEVAVRATAQPRQLIYATTAAGPLPTGGRTMTIRFNNQGQPPDGQGPAGKLESWTLTARQIPGALDAAVATARWRNLGVGVLLIGLTLAAGLALTHFTRRSRKLAEAQLQFVAGVSHELRTPLTVIRGAAHNLQRGIAHDPARIEQYARLILRHSDQLGDMVEQVLELARNRRRDAAFSLREVAVGEILTAAIAATADDAAAAGCRVQADLPADLPAVRGDAEALRRVFQNLLANAAKHGGKGRWIGVSASFVDGSNPSGVEIRVSDRGDGVPKDEQNRVFEPFFRGGMAQRNQTRGSGLGLSLVREIVQAHGGSVAVGSNDPPGATFVVRLPAAKVDRPSQDPTPD